VLGHEWSAVVEEVGTEVTYVKPGDRVITCTSVLRHLQVLRDRAAAALQQRQRQDAPDEAQRLFWQGKPVVQFANLSSFAEQLLVHQNAVVKVADDIPLNIGCLVGCGIITGAGAVLNTAKVPAGATVEVFGCGGIGLSAVNDAAIAGADRVIAVGALI
jgi:S-(hydroxymethyl)glutathione dehydrogenase/alcohol dehydrogenase